MAKTSKNVCVVVLGDVGRSPRMQYHSLSLAQEGHTVDIIGYGDTEPLEEIKKSSSIYYHYLLPCPTIPIRLLNYVFKTIFQAFNLLFLLSIIRKSDTLIVQNPPAIPALIICFLYCKLVRAKFIIDWHNYAHTIMALSLSKDNILVRITKKVERFIGQRSNVNFCVTNAMKKDLFNNWNIEATTLYDKPPIIFKSLSLDEKKQFLQKFSKQFNVSIENRGIIASSTSWTEDEDFSVLFTALQEFESHINEGNLKHLPDIVCIITGKGYLKEFYCKLIERQNWKHITVVTPWLEAEDYPNVLASADLGVCLHKSSSGLDLPMKVVDMFGCGLPVCAYNFKCLNELVQDGKNGFIFENSDNLSKHLQKWFEKFPNNAEQRLVEEEMKKNIKSFQDLRWKENWNNVASPLI